MTEFRIENKAYLFIGALLVVGILSSTAARPAFATSELSASPGVISLGGTVTLTQTWDQDPAIVKRLLVLEPDNDVCKATTTPAPVSSGSPYSAVYPTEFVIVIANGDGICNTNGVGEYTARSGVGDSEFTCRFATNFLVIPESPIGAAALMGSSLAALGGYLGLRRFKATKT